MAEVRNHRTAELRAACVWQEPDGWHYQLLGSMEQAVRWEHSVLTPTQRMNSFVCEAGTQAALRASYWQLDEADRQAGSLPFYGGAS